MQQQPKVCQKQVGQQLCNQGNKCNHNKCTRSLKVPEPAVKVVVLLMVKQTLREVVKRFFIKQNRCYPHHLLMKMCYLLLIKSLTSQNKFYPFIFYYFYYYKNSFLLFKSASPGKVSTFPDRTYLYLHWT